MPSNASKAFNQSAKDVKRLLEIHRNLSGSGPGRRHRLEVLNKSAIVLVTAIWEAYCEDLTAEALDHLVTHARDAAAMPKELKKRIAKELKAEINEIAIWDLADNGWREKMKNRFAALTEDRNKRFNTPKSELIDQLFLEGVGLTGVSSQWRWQGMSSKQARKKLDDYVSLRGAIAHRGKGASSCTKVQVEDYFRHIRRLVNKTGPTVNRFVRAITRKKPW